MVIDASINTDELKIVTDTYVEGVIGRVGPNNLTMYNQIDTKRKTSGKINQEAALLSASYYSSSLVKVSPAHIYKCI